MSGAAAKRQPTESELKAHLRHTAFHEKIAEKAASLKEKRAAASKPVDAAPAPVEPPAEVVPIEAPPLPFAPMKTPWFRIDGVTAPPPPRVAEIQMVVCEGYGVRMVDMTSARRTANLVRPRQVAMYLAKTMTGKSLPEIGRRFGGRDHTTVLWAIRKITGKVEFNAEDPEAFDAELSELVSTLRAKIEALRGE